MQGEVLWRPLSQDSEKKSFITLHAQDYRQTNTYNEIYTPTLEIIFMNNVLPPTHCDDVTHEWPAKFNKQHTILESENTLTRSIW